MFEYMDKDLLENAVMLDYAKKAKALNVRIKKFTKLHGMEVVIREMADLVEVTTGKLDQLDKDYPNG